MFIFSVAISVCLFFVQVSLNYDLLSVAGTASSERSILPSQLILNSSHSRQVFAKTTIQSNTSHASSKNPLRKLLLSVPFYVYEDLAWKGAQWDRKPIKDFITENDNTKHADDYWFMRNALRHPMRTQDASEAQLFVIPSLHNFFDSRAFHKTKRLCLKGVCGQKLMVLAAETVVTSSPYFQNRSEAHLAVVSHFVHHKRWWSNQMPALYKTMLTRSSNIQFEDFKTNDPDRWSVPKLHVGRACPLQTRKRYDVALIATLKNDTRFRDRERICSWLQKYTVNNTQGGGLFRMQQCGQGTQCPSLAEAKLGFHVRGDTPSSSRLCDTVLSGTVPIFTLHEQYQVLPDWFDWERISYFLDMKTLEEATFVRKLSAIINDTEAYQRKLDLVLANRHLFDWTGLYPFDTYMYMLQTTLYPETAHDPTSFYAPNQGSSILRLPQPPS